MVLYKVYSQAHRIRYFAHPCSSAVLFQICCLLLTFVPPLFTSYFTGGFYYKELTYGEQPYAAYSGKYHIIIGSPSSTTIFSSSDSRLNKYFASSYYAASSVRTGAARDTNGDGIVDQNTVTIDVVLPGAIQGRTINLWLLFQYSLNRYSTAKTEALGVVSVKAPASLLENTTATIYGQLRLHQRNAITSSTDLTSQNPVMNFGLFSVVPSLDTVLNDYYSRDYFTTFDPDYVQWTTTAATTRQLTLKVVINTSLQSIRYVPSFWKEFRWAWIQYVTALIPFLYVMNKVKEFAFCNRLLRTFVKKSA